MIDTTGVARPERAADAPAVSDRVQAACDVAAGRIPADPASIGTRVTGACKDLNSKGRGPYWFRLVWRHGAWRYISSDRLPAGNYLASERRASVYGEVFPGELVAQHERGHPVEKVWIVARPNSEGQCLIPAFFVRRRDGNLAITLPDGSEVVVPDPRK